MKTRAKMFKVFTSLLILALTSNLVNSVKVNLNIATCDVEECTNCGPSVSKNTQKQLVCYGPEEFSIDGEISNKNYTILLSSATQSTDQISRLVLTRMNVIKQFKPNIVTELKSILIERSIVKVIASLPYIYIFITHNLLTEINSFLGAEYKSIKEH